MIEEVQPLAALGLVQQAGQFAAAASVSVTLPQPATVGNLLVAFVSGFSNATPTFGGSVTVNSWTALGSPSMGVGSLNGAQYAGIVTGAGTTVSVTIGTSAYAYLTVAEFSTRPASVVADGSPTTAFNLTGGNQPAAPSYTSSNANDLIIAMSNIQGSSDNGPPAGWNGLPLVNGQMSAIWKAATPASFAPVWASTANTGWVAACAGIAVPKGSSQPPPDRPPSALIEETSEGTQQAN